MSSARAAFHVATDPTRRPGGRDAAREQERHLRGAAGSAGMGSTGPADAATEAFIRHLAAEVGPQGVRVLGIHQGRDEAAFAELVGRYRRELHYTATGCSACSRRPRTWSRRPSRAPGA